VSDFSQTSDQFTEECPCELCRGQDVARGFPPGTPLAGGRELTMGRSRLSNPRPAVLPEADKTSARVSRNPHSG
jgi:hypothetical protein